MDRADLAIKMSKLVHDKCKDVPHDIGLQLLYLIEEYDGAFRQPPVISSVCECEGMYCNIEIEKNECWLCRKPIKLANEGLSQ